MNCAKSEAKHFCILLRTTTITSFSLSSCKCIHVRHLVPDSNCLTWIAELFSRIVVYHIIIYNILLLFILDSEWIWNVFFFCFVFFVVVWMDGVVLDSGQNTIFFINNRRIFIYRLKLVWTMCKSGGLKFGLAVGWLFFFFFDWMSLKWIIQSVVYRLAFGICHLHEYGIQ